MSLSEHLLHCGVGYCKMVFLVSKRQPWRMQDDYRENGQEGADEIGEEKASYIGHVLHNLIY